MPRLFDEAIRTPNMAVNQPVAGVINAICALLVASSKPKAIAMLAEMSLIIENALFIHKSIHQQLTSAGSSCTLDI